MSQTAEAKSPDTRLPRTIRSTLARLRFRIRIHVMLDGLASALLWLCLTFWLFCAADYLPILLWGRNELPRWVRAILLLGIALASFWILYRSVFKRLIVGLRDSSMALLLERKFPQLEESLITSLEAISNEPTAPHSQMLQRTRRQAESVLGQITVGEVINPQPLVKKLIAVGLFCLTILGFAIFRPTDFQIASSRLYLLDSQTWPRQCQIGIVGIQVKRENLIEGIDELNQMVQMQDGEFKVARGSNLTLFVEAETVSKESGNSIRKLPDSCVLYYRSADGIRGQQSFKRIGAARNGVQLYSLAGPPLQGVLSDVTLSIRGGDHRIGPYKLRVVDAPVVIETKLACEFPPYMVDPVSLRWTPRTVPWTGHAQLPQGTKIRVIGKANKMLAKIYAFDVAKKHTQVLHPQDNSFEFDIHSLWEPTTTQFYLCDTDGIVNEQPHHVSIHPIEDQPPNVQTLLDGIGTAVTPDVRIPITGQIEDDYGVARQWVSIETPVTEPRIADFETSKGDFETEIDFREMRQQSRDAISLPTGEGNQVVVTVVAEDGCNLRDRPNLGSGDRYVLDLVSPGELLRILERLEVGQRRRLEQIYAEVSEARDSLIRSKSSRFESNSLTEPGDNSTDVTSEDIGPMRRDELRLLFSQRADLQVGKSMDEILGISIEFDSIRKQLINNRVDSEDRKQRLSDQIVAPLRLIVTESMQQLKKETQRLSRQLLDLQTNPNNDELSESADEQAVNAIALLDVVLTELDQVLSILVKYETQNELLDIIRLMIKEQQEITERTQKERKRIAFEGLLDQ